MNLFIFTQEYVDRLIDTSLEFELTLKSVEYDTVHTLVLKYTQVCNTNERLLSVC